jgi:hypothetical protein
MLPHDYVPIDARPYFHPAELTSEHVDPGIWTIVQQINQSGWVWTLESCEGHVDGWSPDPLLRLTVEDADAPRLLTALFSSLESAADLTVAPSVERVNRMEVYRHVPAPMPGWFEVRIVVRGPDPLGALARFAGSVTDAA